MSDLELIIAGAAAGIAALYLLRYFLGDPTTIDPSTGAVYLPPGVTFGPPAPITGGLA